MVAILQPRVQPVTPRGPEALRKESEDRSAGEPDFARRNHTTASCARSTRRTLLRVKTPPPGCPVPPPVFPAQPPLAPSAVTLARPSIPPWYHREYQPPRIPPPCARPTAHSSQGVFLAS